MFLFLDPDPIFSVLVLRFSICSASLAGVVLLAAEAVKGWREALK